MGRAWEQRLRAQRAEFLRKNDKTESLRQELRDARAEIAELKELLHNRAKYAQGLRAENQRRKDAEIKRYRELLRRVEDQPYYPEWEEDVRAALEPTDA